MVEKQGDDPPRGRREPRRTDEALGELRRQGRAWNHAPFGWQVDSDRVLIADGTEQETLARARELRAEGLGYAKVAERLTAEGRATKRGGPWQAMSVRSVLRTSEVLMETASAYRGQDILSSVAVVECLL